VSDVASDRCPNIQGFLTKNVKEIFWDLEFLLEVTGCWKTQVSDRTGSTVYTHTSQTEKCSRCEIVGLDDKREITGK
jgi:hypothetical protein